MYGLIKHNDISKGNYLNPNRGKNIHSNICIRLISNHLVLYLGKCYKLVFSFLKFSLRSLNIIHEKKEKAPSYKKKY